MRQMDSIAASIAASAASLHAAQCRLAGPWLLSVDHCDLVTSASAGDLGARGWGA